MSHMSEHSGDGDLSGGVIAERIDETKMEGE